LLNENDIVIARTGGTIGKSFLVKGISLKSLFASYLIRVVPNKTISAEYLKFFLESPTYWKQLYDAAWGAGQPNVNATALSNLLTPLPPLSEQNRIVAEIKQQLTKTRQIKACVKVNQQATEQLLKAMLQKAFEKNYINKNINK
jgi:restriction endonuclease S subunit